MPQVLGPDLPDRIESLPTRPARLIAQSPREYLRLNDDAVLGGILLGLVLILLIALRGTDAVQSPTTRPDVRGGIAGVLGVALLVTILIRGVRRGVFVSREGVLIRGVVSNRRLPWDGLVVTVGLNPYNKADRFEWLLFSSPATGPKPLGGPGWQRTPGRIDDRWWRFDEVAEGFNRLAAAAGTVG